MPRLPGGVVLGGPVDALAPEAQAGGILEVPGELARLIALLEPAWNGREPEAHSDAWQVDGIRVDVTQIDVDGRVKAAAMRLWTAAETATLRLWGSSVAVDGYVVGIQAPTGAGTVTLFAATGSPLAIVPGERALVSDGVTELALQPVDMMVSGGEEVHLLLVASDVWSADVGVQFGQNLAATLGGEAERGRLVIAGGADRTQVMPGDYLQFTLRKANVGTGSSTDVHTELPVPVQLQINAASLAVTTGDAAYDAETGRITWSVDRVPVGAVMQLTYEAMVR